MDRRDELDQVLSRRSIPADRLDRRSTNMLMVVKPLLTQIDNGNRLVAQCRRCADYQLGIDLGGHLARLLAVGTDARLPPPALLDVGQIPDLAAEVNTHATDAKRRSFFCSSGRSFREGSRYKTLQKALQTGLLRRSPKTQVATYQRLMERGQQ